MPTTPREVEEVLEQLRSVLLTWYEHDVLGEVAILHGGHEWTVEERPRRRLPGIKRKIAHKTR